MQIEVACRKLLKPNGVNGVLRSSMCREWEDFSLISYCETVRNFELGSGEQQAVSAEAAVGGKVVNGEEDDDEEHLCFFENNISVDIFYTFVVYRALSGNDNRLEGRIMELAHLDVGTDCSDMLITEEKSWRAQTASVRRQFQKSCK